MTYFGDFNDLFSTRQEIVHEGVTRIRPSGDDDVGGDAGGVGGDVDVEEEYSDDLIGGGGEADDYSDVDEGDEGDSEGGGQKFVSSYADRERVSAAGGTSDVRFKTPAEKAEQKLRMVFDSDYFASSNDLLVRKLMNAFGNRLPTLNLHTLAATAVWMTTEHERTDKVLGDYCKAKRIDPADLLRYQTIIGKKLKDEPKPERTKAK